MKTIEALSRFLTVLNSKPLAAVFLLALVAINNGKAPQAGANPSCQPASLEESPRGYRIAVPIYA